MTNAEKYPQGYAGIIHHAKVKATGAAYYYAVQTAWGARRFTADIGADYPPTWHGKLSDARKAAEAAGSIRWVAPAQEG